MDIPAKDSILNFPRSASNFRLNFLCLGIFFAAVFFMRRYSPGMKPVHVTMVGLLAIVIPLWFHDLIREQVFRHASAGLREDPGPVNLERLIVKLAGLYGTFLIIIIAYHLNPTYWISERAVHFYSIFFYFLNFLAPWIIALSIPYFWFVDRRQQDPYDSYWHAGCLFIGRFDKVNFVILKEHGRAWFIKAFFTPFMFAILVEYVQNLFFYPWRSGFLPIHDSLVDLFYTVDVLYGVLGYILALRILDTHIQSTEPTILGWLACLACYSPFSSLYGIELLSSNDYLNWNHWLASFPTAYYFIAFVILLLTFINCLSTVSFGYHFSNLTYRGIITSGPYRFTKHPAYISKVASWWLISLPFFSAEGPLVALINTLNLSTITFIYYLRARTEENHLSNYPEYVRYAEWINEHGIFRSLGKLFPVLQYSEEKCKRWGSVVWFKKL